MFFLNFFKKFQIRRKCFFYFNSDRFIFLFIFLFIFMKLIEIFFVLLLFWLRNTYLILILFLFLSEIQILFVDMRLILMSNELLSFPLFSLLLLYFLQIVIGLFLFFFCSCIIFDYKRIIILKRALFFNWKFLSGFFSIW